MNDVDQNVQSNSVRIRDLVFLNLGHCPLCCRSHSVAPGFAYKKNTGREAVKLLIDLLGDDTVKGYAIAICLQCTAYMRDINAIPDNVKYMIQSGEFEIDIEIFNSQDDFHHEKATKT